MEMNTTERMNRNKDKKCHKFLSLSYFGMHEINTVNDVVGRAGPIETNGICMDG